MKKLLALLLCLALLGTLMFTLVGCDESDDADSDDEKTSESSSDEDDIGSAKPEDLIVGTWHTELDMTKMMTDSFGTNATLQKYFKVDKFTMAMNWEFSKDKTLTVSVDKEHLATQLKNIKNAFKAGMEQYITDLLKENNVNMTVDEFLEKQNTSWDELLGQFTVENILASSNNQMEKTSTYEFKDGKLYIDSDETTFEFKSKNKLEMGPAVIDEEDTMKDFYPLVFTRK